MYRITFPFEFIALLLILSGNFLPGLVLGGIATTVGYFMWKNEQGL